MYSISALAEAAAETAWHNAVKACWNSATFKAFIPATNVFQSTTTYTMSPTWHATTATSTPEAIPGAGAAALPYTSCLIATLRSAQKNKKGVGRLYFPALTQASLSVNGWSYSAATMTAAGTAFAAMWASLAGSLTPVILHRSTLTTDNIVHGDLPDDVATQRRRAHKRIPTRTVFL
jgi:hypothetical protein